MIGFVNAEQDVLLLIRRVAHGQVSSSTSFDHPLSVRRLVLVLQLTLPSWNIQLLNAERQQDAFFNAFLKAERQQDAFLASDQAT